MVDFNSLKSYFLNLYESSVLILKFGFVLVRRFKNSCKIVSIARSQGQLSDEQFYTLYGLYKQARFGDYEDYWTCFSANSSNKLESWKKLKGMSSKDAAIEYIRYSEQVLATFKDSADFETNAGVFSRIMIMDSIEETFEFDDLFTSVVEGDFDKVRNMIEKQPKLVDVRSPEGLTALHLAADRGHLDIVMLLLDNGANVNVVDDSGDTPLHVALESEQEDVVQLLLARGGDLEQRNYEGLRPIDLINLSKM